MQLINNVSADKAGDDRCNKMMCPLTRGKRRKASADKRRHADNVSDNKIRKAAPRMKRGTKPAMQGPIRMRLTKRSRWTFWPFGYVLTENVLFEKQLSEQDDQQSFL